MTYELITNRDLGKGIHVIFQYVNDITGGLFMPSVILMLYLVISLGMYFMQKRMTSKGSAAVCFAVASYIMVGFVVLLGMIPGLINGYTIVEIIVLACVSTLWLLFSRNREY